MRKIISKIKYHSAIIFPVISTVLLLIADKKYKIFLKIPENKIDILVDIIISIVGIFNDINNLSFVSQNWYHKTENEKYRT